MHPLGDLSEKSLRFVHMGKKRVRCNFFGENKESACLVKYNMTIVFRHESYNSCEKISNKKNMLTRLFHGCEDFFGFRNHLLPLHQKSTILPTHHCLQKMDWF